MEITREVDLDATLDEVWELLSDPEELAGWVGDEVRGARIAPPDEAARRLRWTWSPDGRESEVELAVEQVGDRTRVRVVERGGSSSSARACLHWDSALLELEHRCLTRAHQLVLR